MSRLLRALQALTRPPYLSEGTPTHRDAVAILLGGWIALWWLVAFLEAL